MLQVFVVYTAGWNKLESVVMENEQALTACDQVNKYFFVFTKHVLKTQCVDFCSVEHNDYAAIQQLHLSGEDLAHDLLRLA